MSRIKITGIRLEKGSNGLEHIDELLWVKPDVTVGDGVHKLLLAEGVCSREMLVNWLLLPGNSAFTEDVKTSQVAEVIPHPQKAPYYVRTNPDNEKQDNLLYLSQNWPEVSPYNYRLPDD